MDFGHSRTRTASSSADFTRAASRLRAARACRPHAAPHVLRPLPAAAGEENLKRLINWVLACFAQLDIPVKRGTFVEFRQGACLIPRRCSRPRRPTGPPPLFSTHVHTRLGDRRSRRASPPRALRAQACSTCRPSAATARARSETSLKSRSGGLVGGHKPFSHGSRPRIQLFRRRPARSPIPSIRPAGCAS